MVMLKIAAITSIFLMTTVAHAAPVTYACTLLEGHNSFGMYDDVDQVVIDTEVQYIELRVARTMGTAAEVNWVFTNRDGYDGTPEEMWMRTTATGAVLAAGLDSAGSYSFRFSTGYLAFGVTYSAPAMAFTWQCKP
jgi:hypothetical protein